MALARKKAKRWKGKARRWRAKFAGTCARCEHKFERGALIADDPPRGYVHNQCHPDWTPPPLLAP
jgi:hypothetical protein